MSTRREFMKQAGVLGTAATFFAATQRGENNSYAEDSPENFDDDPKISYTVPFDKQMTATPQKRKITVPNVGEFCVLKGDFHIHTIFSDGLAWPIERVVEADGNGLDVIAITDHIEYRPYLGGINGKIKLRDENENYNFSYELAKPEADKRKLLLVRGTEITKSKMPPGHFNALFIEDVNKIAAEVSDYRKMFEETVKQGGFLLWNHPGWQAPKSGGIELGAPTILTAEHEEIYKNGWMHGIEAFNHKEFYPVVTSWCTEKDLAVFSNSDIHQTEIQTYGVRHPKRPINLIFAKEKTLESVKEAFFAKRVVGWVADMILGQEKWVRPLFESCVETKGEGDKFIFANRSSISVTLQIGEQTVQLAPLGTAEAKRTTAIKTMTVTNWQIGKNKSLTIEVEK
jgi:hypothetical protein